jgi:hypothetical protein
MFGWKVEIGRSAVVVTGDEELKSALENEAPLNFYLASASWLCGWDSRLICHLNVVNEEVV